MSPQEQDDAQGAPGGPPGLPASPAAQGLPSRGLADCADVMLRLIEFVDDEAAVEDQWSFRAHLEACSSCLQEYERDLLVKAMVRRACGCEPAPPELRHQILARISTLSVTETAAGRTVVYSEYTEQSHPAESGDVEGGGGEASRR